MLSDLIVTGLLVIVLAMMVGATFLLWREKRRILGLMFGFSSIICLANVALSISNWWKPC